ncbi:MAG: D-sedoheptulose 7-phosphate isomerase [Endomicrobia bacterium]|nr:D-sedoheptulose 7-phosphate isomerase [Endomicrobiia bacterium]
MKDKIRNLIKESIDIKELFLKDIKQINLLEKVILEIINAFNKNKKLIVFGNGGSAADAQHMVAELVGRYKKERKALNAIALSTNTSTITALGNDYGYEVVFSRQLEACVDKGDVVFGISTSGNSVNVLKAIEVAKKYGCVTIGLTGAKGGKLKDMVKYCICVPSNDTPRIQEMHITIIHIICELIEEKIFS